MALRRDKLLDALDQLRDQIRQEEQLKTGRNITVCSDSVIKEIADKKPLKISDFLAISGVGKVFMDQYASSFLKVVLEYQTLAVKEVKVSRKAYKVLDHYKDRLTNISRRNPNLYMGKVTKKKSFDLALLEKNEEIAHFLTNKRLVNFNLDFPSSYKGDLLERHVTNLYRETNKDEKETGSYDLYIGYPYIEGVFKKDNFAIKAPLLYFPIKLVRNKRQLIIKKDKDKDILYNRDLLLAASKMEKNDFTSNVPLIQDFNLKTIRDVVVPYYIKNGINIQVDNLKFDFEYYQEDRKDQFVKGRKKGVFSLKEYITFGRYKLYSSMIQKDMNAILDSNKYNDLLEDLISEKALFEDEKAVDFSLDQHHVKEEKLSYINPINYSQEKVIDLINSENKLVIWGPPGTGKSQTITSLIASSILKGENVLVVSEKKVALDVIYSRLKEASKYAMFIDDAENKQDFYYKLSQILNPSLPQRTLNNDIYKLEQEIKQITKTMDKSLKLLYVDTIQDVPMNELYKRYVKDKDVVKTCSPKQVHEMMVETFKKPDFKVLNDLEKTFEKRSHFINFMNHYKIVSQFPLFHKLETKIARSNRLELEDFTRDLNIFLHNYETSWWFKRRRIKRTFIQGNLGRLRFLAPSKRLEKKYLKTIVNDNRLHDYIMENINRINKLKAQYNALTKHDITFIEMMLYHPLMESQKDVVKLRKYVFDAFYTGYLEEFKAHNQKYLYIFEKYHDKINELEELMQEKLQVTTESFEMELYKHALDLSNTKRIMDLKRVLESSRKLSVKAFIDTFQVELMNHIRVWMMTPEVVSAIIPLVYGMFDLVIFDEASQMYVEKGIPAIYRAKKVVIAGDTKQLRPSSLGIGRLEDDDEFYEEDVLKDISMDAKSLLDLARYRYKETILNYHYRSVYEELISFSNHAFYDGKLIVSPNQKQSERPPIEYIHVKDGIFENRRNKQEAKKVIQLLRKILKERQNNETIGVITFNSTQRDEIENQIDEELFKRGKYQRMFEQELFRKDDGEDTSLFVKNIENVQGDERDIIIFSMGYARDVDGYIRRRFGWLNNDGGQNRLNVAISRAKKKIYFVSSLFPEELKVEDLKSKGPRLLKEYMRYCYYVSHKKHDMAKEVLNELHRQEESHSDVMNDMVDDIARRLERNGYTVKTQIGIGNYSINLAVYDEEADEYKLGIIVDVDSKRHLEARRDLYHQEKYLEARNWTLYRVFGYNWYVDPNKEMRAIRDLIK
jgi:KaiC/GvpD/RAD55 family RecA-like ATPase/very-short-patch-repair endonuclease